MRLFVAVVPPDEVIDDLDRFLEPRRAVADFRWAPPGQWHLTLAFAPDVPERLLDELTERVAAAAARRTPLRLRLAGGGAFPDVARAKVLWCGLDGDVEELARVAKGARTACATSGAEVDGGRFRAHLTLGRLGRPAEVSSWVRLLDAYAGPEWVADEVTVFASHLGEGPRGRPRHEPLGVFSLGSATWG